VFPYKYTQAARVYALNMRYVPFPGAGSGATRISALGFGCSGVMGRVGRSDSLRALEAATEAGINFFDTARSYGYGESEGLLGEFLQGQRESAIVCTKFGIQPVVSGGWKQRIKPLAQTAIKLFPGLRGLVRRQVHQSASPVQFSADLLRSSLETSLRELRTEYVDMLLLHGALVETLDDAELFDCLASLVAEGKVRMAGVSGEHDVIFETSQKCIYGVKTTQFAMDPLHLHLVEQLKKSKPENMFMVANHPFGGAEGVRLATEKVRSIAVGPSLPASLRERLNLNDPQLLPEIIFGSILEQSGISAVIASMLRTEHIHTNVSAMDSTRFTGEELILLRERLAR
jgi:aryl-alcohol dehydrogenase-like predicted oxidoreductase